MVNLKISSTLLQNNGTMRHTETQKDTIMWSTTTMKTWKLKSHILCCNVTSHIKWHSLLGWVIFGDEGTFCWSGDVNKHSLWIWRNENPHACVEQSIGEYYFVPRVLCRCMVLSSSWRGMELVMCIWIWQKISVTMSWWKQFQKPLKLFRKKVHFLSSILMCNISQFLAL